MSTDKNNRQVLTEETVRSMLKNPDFQEALVQPITQAMLGGAQFIEILSLYWEETINHNVPMADISETPVVSKKSAASIATKRKHWVTAMLRYLGCPANIKGYTYVREAILFAISDHSYVESITRLLYPDIAKKYNTTHSRVERAIRHAIEKTWDRCDLEILKEIFGSNYSSKSGKVTNSEFIALLADRYLLEE